MHSERPLRGGDDLNLIQLCLLFLVAVVAGGDWPSGVDAKGGPARMVRGGVGQYKRRGELRRQRRHLCVVLVVCKLCCRFKKKEKKTL